jgi:hypothetical protein
MYILWIGRASVFVMPCLKEFAKVFAKETLFQW